MYCQNMNEDYVIDEVPEHMQYRHDFPQMLRQLSSVPCMARIPSPREIDLTLDCAEDIELDIVKDISP